MGQVVDFDLSEMYDNSGESLNEGALRFPYSMEGWYGRIFQGCGC